jgi:hypothetical protein
MVGIPLYHEITWALAKSIVGLEMELVGCCFDSTSFQVNNGYAGAFRMKRTRALHHEWAPLPLDLGGIDV